MHRRCCVTFGEVTAQTVASPSASHVKIQSSLLIGHTCTSLFICKKKKKERERGMGIPGIPQVGMSQAFFQLPVLTGHVPSSIVCRVKVTSTHVVRPGLLVITLTKYVLSRFPDSPCRTEIKKVSIMIKFDNHESFNLGLPNCKKRMQLHCSVICVWSRHCWL